MKKTVEIIKGFFAKDLLWKVFSLIVAVALWFVVMNTLNPTETKTFTANLSFVNEAVLTEGDTAFTIINKKDIENTKVTLKVKGTRPALDELAKAKNRANISAYVDLKQLSTVTLQDSNEVQNVTLSVTPKLPDNIFLYSYEIVSCTPGTVEAKIDRLQSETMKLQLNITGELKSGYNASEPICETDTVKITGPKSMFNNVAAVKAGVDIAGKTDDVNVSVAPAVYDTNGQLMELFTVEPAVIDVSISINKQWQIPVTAPETVGELNENLVLESIEYEPKTVEVEGTLSDINKVSSIQVPAVNLSAIEHTETFSYDIRPSLKGTELKLKNNSATEIKVTVTVNAKAARDVAINQADFQITGLADGLSADIDVANVTIYGAQEVIDTVTAAQLAPKLDLSGQTTGWHSVSFSITPPENVEVRVEPRVTVVIKNKEQVPTHTEAVPENEPTTQAALPSEETTEGSSEEQTEHSNEIEQ